MPEAIDRSMGRDMLNAPPNECVIYWKPSEAAPDEARVRLGFAETEREVDMFTEGFDAALDMLKVPHGFYICEWDHDPSEDENDF